MTVTRFEAGRFYEAPVSVVELLAPISDFLASGNVEVIVEEEIDLDD